MFPNSCTSHLFGPPLVFVKRLLSNKCDLIFMGDHSFKCGSLRKSKMLLISQHLGFFKESSYLCLYFHANYPNLTEI